ncbi:uncharacterized protein LOC128218937 [Mya arenaria]|uniref:uncharacterized protein LOC128218937 n=1 Tax=Mya arenaria TaxID=6604 RepID=UPI0022E155E7|nr:uncharacterized protein LOC128218937 [Mya arenaria]
MSEPLYCNIHGELVTALCVTHKDYLCTQCLISGDHNTCEKNVLTKFNTEKDKCFIKYISVRNQMSCKENEVKKRMEKIHSSKERLELEINATFDRLKEKLEEMRGNTLQELADVESKMSNKYKQIKEKIEGFRENIKTVFDSVEAGNVQKLKKQLEKTEVEMLTTCEIPSEMKAKYSFSKNILEILNSKESCGRLRFEEYHYYEPINLENQKTEPYGSEDYYEFKAGANTDKDKSTKDGQDGPPPKSETPTPEVTELAKYKSHSYSLSDHSDFQKTPEFVEIILTSHGLVLLDSANGVLVLSDDKNGKIKNVVKVPFTLECITGVSSDRIAVLGKTKAETCIRVYKSSLNGLKEKPKESFKIVDGSKCVGLDFDNKKKLFVVNFVDKLLFIKPNGKLNYTSALDNPFKKSDMKSVYDSEGNRVYTVYPSEQACLCYSLQENKCLWKREEKGKRSDFSPSNLALHGNKLYIVSDRVLLSLSMDTGESSSDKEIERRSLSILACFITDTNQAILTTRSSEKTEALTVTFIELEKKG